nr:hypothetical protein [Tanacetum cinerariifolium]
MFRITLSSTEELASSTETLSSLQNLKKELSFTNQFFVEKQHNEEPGKTNAEAEVQSMVSVPIHQDTSSVHPVTNSVINLTTLDKHGSRLYKLENLNIPHKVSKAVNKIITDAVDWAMQAPLRACFSNLPTIDMQEILQQRMFESKSFKAHEDHKKLYDALEKSLERDYSNQLLSDLEEARQKKKKRRDIPRTPSGSLSPQPTPPHPLAGTSGAQGTLGASGSSQLPLPPPLPSTAGVSGTQELSPMDSLIYDDSIADEQIQLSDDEDFKNDHLPKANSRKDRWKPLPKEERPTTPKPAWTIPSSNLLDTGDMTNFMNWYCHQVNKTKLTQADLEGQAYEVVKAFYPDVINIYKGSSPALSISKIKAASYPGFGLELLVPEQIWIEDVCTYEISAKYGSSHWWCNRQKFYIDRHESPSHRKKSDHTCRFSVSSELKPTQDVGDLDHLPGSNKKMLSTAVKLWTQNLEIRQRVEDFQLGIESYQTQLNLTKPGWDAAGYESKHDNTILESPRAVVFSINNNKRKIMRFNEIYKFSDGTLTRILEALAYRVKEFKIMRLNPGMNVRFWTQKDVTRSKEFIAAIESRLKTRRIYRNLECFVGGRVRDIDYKLLLRTE